MTPIDEIASRLYAVYCLKVDGKAFNGDALPSWAEFEADKAKQKQVEAWREVAREAVRILCT